MYHKVQIHSTKNIWNCGQFFSEPDSVTLWLLKWLFAKALVLWRAFQSALGTVWWLTIIEVAVIDLSILNENLRREVA